MSDVQCILKNFLIMPNLVSKSDTNYIDSETEYNSIINVETCLRNDENWNLFFQHNFELTALKNEFNSISDEQKTKIFKFGIACLLEFVHCNFTGPGIEKQIEEYITQQKFLEYSFEKELSVNNDDVNIDTQHPVLLFTAKIIFEWCLVNDIANNWWQCRAILIHQELLDELSPSLLSDVDRLCKQIESNASLKGNAKASLHVEMAQIYLLFRNLTKAKQHIIAATEILGVNYNFIGVMGKRTKHQEKELAQLTIEVKVNPKDNSVERLEVHSMEVPQDIPLNDDLRLNTIQFVSKVDDKVMLTNLEQKLFLAIIQDILIYSPPDELRGEELQPFIHFLLNQKSTYTVQVAALLLRCKYESKNRRTIERSLIQCEELIKCWSRESPHFMERVMDVFGTGTPPIWKIERLYADLLLNIGLVKNALDIYLKINLWEEVIVCYTILKLRHKAAEVIKEQLEQNPSVKLWCLLGDATDDISCYEKAWEMSKRRSHRAQRHWGQYLFDRKQYEDCIPHYEKSVSINPLQSSVWFRLGYAALQVENWQIAATAYRRYSALEPDNFEAWNNLAQAYIKLGNNRSAHHAILEALKCNFENWKVWENLLVVSCDIANFADVIRAYHRLLDLKDKYLNMDVLNILVYNVCNDMNDCEGQSSKRFLQKTRELFGRVTAIYPGEGFVWELYANLAPSLILRAQRLQKAYRGYTQGGWDKSPPSCQQVLYVCNKLAEIVLESEFDSKDPIINSIRLNLSSAVTAVKKQDWEETRELVEQLSNHLEKVTEKIKRNQSTDNISGS